MCLAAHDHDRHDAPETDSDAAEWWPVELSDAETDAMAAFYDVLEAEAPALDLAAATRADQLISGAMQRWIGEIIDGSVLSHYCHLLNGWGDATRGGHRLSEGLAGFCQPDVDGRPHLVQFDRDGDFHPGQTLAYAVMAGMDVDREIPRLGGSLRDLYARSRTLQTDDGAELGHLLFGLAHLGVDTDTRFTLPDATVDVAGLMERAIHGHHHGHFRVCRKVHLCEGICAAAAMLPGLSRYRAQAQAFLDGQLDLMLLLAMLLERLGDPETTPRDVQPGGLCHRLRQTLATADRFEDHVFLAGHTIELAVFAGGMGYEVSAEHRSAMVRIANAIDTALPAWLPRSPFAEQFLFYGHYRRALTLLPAFLEGGPGWTPDAATRAAFTVDFDALRVPALAPVEPARPWAFTSAEAAIMRPRFTTLLETFAALAPAELAPRGYRSHFRHIKPAGWPQALHYELLDYGEAEGRFSMEIHLESEAVRPLRATLFELLEPVRARFPGARVDVQPDWGRGRGRLRVVVPDDASPSQLAAGMLRLVEETRGPLGDALEHLRATQPEPGLEQPEVFAVA